MAISSTSTNSNISLDINGTLPALPNNDSDDSLTYIKWRIHEDDCNVQQASQQAEQLPTIIETEVQKKLFPQDWIPWIIDKVWNRFLATGCRLLNNDQAKENKAKDLVTNPPTDIIQAIREIAVLNSKLQECQAIPITVENVIKYTELLSKGQIMVRGDDGQILEKTIENVELLIDTSFTNLLTGVTAYKTGVAADSLIKHGKCVVQWANAVQRAGKFYTNDQFGALVVISTKAVTNQEEKKAIQDAIKEVSLTIWTDSRGARDAKFIQGIAHEFTEAIKDMDDAQVQVKNAMETVKQKLEARAKHILITGADYNQHTVFDQLLVNLNNNQTFKTAFIQAQNKLIIDVKNHYSESFIVKEQLKKIKSRQDAVFADARALSSPHNPNAGEAALIPAFSCLLFPQAFGHVLSLTAQPQHLSMQGKRPPIEQYADASDRFCAAYHDMNRELKELFDISTPLIIKGKEKAKSSLNTLHCLNFLVSTQHWFQEIVPGSTRRFWVNVEELEKATCPQTTHRTMSNDILTKPLLKMLIKLAGKKDSEGAPTLLALLIFHMDKKPGLFNAIDPELQDLVSKMNTLGTNKLCDEKQVQVVSTSSNQETANQPINMYVFPHKKDDVVRDIDLLREIFQRLYP